MRRSSHLLIMLVAFIVATRAFAGDENGTNANSGTVVKDMSVPGTKVVVKASATAPTKQALTTSPQVRLIGYISTKASSKTTGPRRTVAKSAFDRAKLPADKGGLGMVVGFNDVVGFRDVEDADTWKDFVSNCCADGEAEAQSYLPLLRRGFVVYVITDANEKEWVFGPAVLNDTMDYFVQISGARSEHERQHPERYRFAAQAAATQPRTAGDSSTPVNAVASIGIPK